MEFSCLYKNITYRAIGNEEIGKSSGNIYINLIAKNHDDFSILNDYNILYRYIVFFDNIDDINSNEINMFKYLDLKTYS